jgi:hypothetical protein
VGTTTGTYAAGDDSRIAGAAQKAQNLADLASASTARSNLGLGTAATQASGAFDAAGAAATAQSAAIADAASKYVALAGAQVINGEKTFNDAIPVAPGFDPAFDNQLTRKAYVDAQAAVVGTVTVSGAAASGKVLTAASSSAASWQTPSGGGGGSSVAFSDGIIVIDDPALTILPTAASWTVVQSLPGTKLQDSFEAQVGDWFEPLGNVLLGGTGSQWLDWALLDNTGAIDTYAGTLTSTPLPQGNPVIYPSTSFNTITSPPVFKIAARHIDGDGKATLALVHQGSGDRKVYTHPELPFQLRTRRTRPA